MKVVFYEGERVYFRPLEMGDEPLLRRWINDPRVWATLSDRLPMNEAREREWLEKTGKDPHDVVFGLAVKADDRLIGTVGLHGFGRPHHGATLGIMIGEVDAQDQGFGTEAVRLAVRFGFEELNLHRIVLDVFDHNPRAIRVYEKAGFRLEGRGREAFYRQGRYRDVLQYAMLRGEWEAEVVVV